MASELQALLGRASRLDRGDFRKDIIAHHVQDIIAIEGRVDVRRHKIHAFATDDVRRCRD
jgi:hypothetical protein